jgi:hypothetical protein
MRSPQRTTWLLHRVALPVLALLGVTNAGWDTILHAAVEPGFTAQHGPTKAAPNGRSQMNDGLFVWLPAR